MFGNMFISLGPLGNNWDEYELKISILALGLNMKPVCGEWEYRGIYPTIAGNELLDS
jgi:hypothetical protein